MLRQSKIFVDFTHPVPGIDIQNGDKFLSDRHWLIAEVMKYDLQTVQFYNHMDELVAQWSCADIRGLSIPQLDSDSPVITEQKSHDYQAVVKKQRPAAWSAWTFDEEYELEEEYKRGLDCFEIADIHNRTPRAIFERLLKLGICPENYPKLGNRPEKRHYEELGIWIGKRPKEGELITVCLGCGHEIIQRPCECWKANSTSDIKMWREHKYIYSMYGDRIGQRY
jgi:hypothetical protein